MLLGRRLLSHRAAACTAAAAAVGVGLAARARADALLVAGAEEDVEVCNWSGTHAETAKLYFQPESSEAVQQLLLAD